MMGDGYRKRSVALFDGLVDGDGSPLREANVDSVATIPVSSSDLGSTSSSCGSPLSANYIEHRVSKMDTLAGIAIKYGVQVAEIRRMNGLVSDLQMFAYKTLQIPLNGRHPPCSFPSNVQVDDREQTPPRRPRSDVLDLLESFNLKPSERNVSPAMSGLQGYYGLPPVRSSPVLGGTEKAFYKTGRPTLSNGLMRTSDPLASKHYKSRSLMNGILTENGKDVDEKSFVRAADREKYFKRRQVSDVGFHTPEKFLEDNRSGFSASAGKGIALRSKSGSRTDIDSMANEDFIDSFVSVRKSSSTPCLQDSENSSSIWFASMWPLKTDALARPIFDGLPNPIAAWRNKAARD